MLTAVFSPALLSFMWWAKSNGLFFFVVMSSVCLERCALALVRAADTCNPSSSASVSANLLSLMETAGIHLYTNPTNFILKGWFLFFFFNLVICVLFSSVLSVCCGFPSSQKYEVISLVETANGNIFCLKSWPSDSKKKKKNPQSLWVFSWRS